MKRGLFVLFVFLLSCAKNDITITPGRTKATVVDAGVGIEHYANTKDTFRCGFASTPYPVIKIINIAPR